MQCTFTGACGEYRHAYVWEEARTVRHDRWTSQIDVFTPHVDARVGRPVAVEARLGHTVGDVETVRLEVVTTSFDRPAGFTDLGANCAHVRSNLSSNSAPSSVAWL